jgi:DNA-binding response OmpR family regulator
MINAAIAAVGSVELCMESAACHVDKHMIVLGDGNDDVDKVLALEAGHDDYVVKPLAPRELVARVRALLRRRRANPVTVIRFGNMEVDRQRRTVTCRGQEVTMTPCEYRLLLFFLSNVDMPTYAAKLLESVWGYSDETNTRTLDAHVSKLRKKV